MLHDMQQHAVKSSWQQQYIKMVIKGTAEGETAFASGICMESWNHTHCHAIKVACPFTTLQLVLGVSAACICQ